jgi:hypothetical protein
VNLSKARGVWHSKAMPTFLNVSKHRLGHYASSA